MLPVLSALSLISLLGYIHGSLHNPAGAYFLTPLRLWELLTGALVQQGALRRLPLPAIAPAGLLILSFELNSDPPFASTVLTVAATALLLPALQPPSRVKTVLSLPALRHLGRLSYSLYLWHWSVICLARWTIGLEGWRLPLLLLVMVSCAEASYRWVETPLRHHGWANSTRGTLLGAGGLTAALAGLMLWLAQDQRSQKFYVGRPTLSVREALTHQQIPGSAISRDNCHLSRNQSVSDPFMQARALLCVAPPARPTMPTVYVAGDSHASALMPLEADLRDRGFGISHLSMNGCPFPATRHGHLNENCSDVQTLWGDWILDHAKPGDSVLIHGFWLSHLNRGIGNTRDELLGRDRRPVRDRDQKRRLFLEAINSFSASASARGIHVLVLGAGPRLRHRGRCLPEWFRPSTSLQACERSLQRQLTHAQEMNAAFRIALSPTITFIDPIPALCGAGCTLDSMRHLLFDDDHLSAQAAQLLLTPVLSELSKAQS